MSQTIIENLKPDAIIRSPLFPEPVKLITTIPLGDNLKLIGTGLNSNQTYQPVLSMAELTNLIITPAMQPFNGRAPLFRLGVEALRLGLAYEYDPYFALSIARIDPLPHQLEAVYDYFIKAPRIRFLLADDPGAGKTIMAGLLIQELKARGLIQRILIITPANLTFQWQRELKDKFRQSFEILNGQVLRPIWFQSLAGKRTGHHLHFLGVTCRGCPKQSDAQPLGLDHCRRGPQNECGQSGKQNISL